jgi:NAD(P)-dependent dehydrogenase (short-subunit alcohol dehydrogenase family)
VNLSGKFFIVTGAFGFLGRAVTACMIAHGARLALLGKRPGSRVEHPADALLYTGIDLSQMPGADFTRWVSPKAVAEVIVFLVSDLARAISGATLPVAGRA